MADDLIEIAAVRSESPEATMALGAALATQLEAGDIIALKGDLGAGKSTFARGLIGSALAQCGREESDIPSPTFTLVQTYTFGSAGDREREIWHIDCWRLETPDEILELGFEEIAGRHIALIEWPEKMAGYLPCHALTIAMNDADDAPGLGRRHLSFQASGSDSRRWREKLAAAGML